MEEMFCIIFTLKDVLFSRFWLSRVIKTKYYDKLKKKKTHHDTVEIVAIIFKHLLFSIYLAKILFVKRKKPKKKLK